MHKRKDKIIAKGYSQGEGIDFSEVFSPVARMVTIRIFLAVTAQQKWPIYQLDVKSAFQNGELKEDVYVTQLEAFVATSMEEMVYKLRKLLYGLRQALRAWYSKVDQHFTQFGFEKAATNP